MTYYLPGTETCILTREYPTRQCLIAASVLLLTRTPATAEEDVSPTDFVAGLCQRNLDARAGRLFTEQEPRAVPYCPRIRALEQQLRDVPNPVQGGILDPWFGPGILPRTPISLVAFRVRDRSDGAARVEADVVISGKPRTNVFSLIRQGDAWLVDNVVYPDGDMVSWFKRYIALGSR